MNNTMQILHNSQTSSLVESPVAILSQSSSKELKMSKKITQFLFLIGFIVFLYFLQFQSMQGAVWTKDDQIELEKRVQANQGQMLELTKELTKAQNEAQLELEKAKAKIKREAESPLMNSTQKDFTSSLVVSKKPHAGSTNKGKGNATIKRTTNTQVMPSYTLKNEKGENLTPDEIQLLMNAYKTQNLKSIQQNFFEYDYEPTQNTMNVLEKKDSTIRIRTRYAMTTTILMESPIEYYVLGDSVGFEVTELPNNPMALTIRPNLVGIDTNLTIFTRDKRLYSFYIFSTDYKSKKAPQLVVNVKIPYTKEEIQKMAEERAIADKLDRETYLTLGSGINKIKIKRDDIDTRYIQKAKKKNKFLMAEEVFSDKQFTYFKYDKEKMPEMPAVWVVVDKKDSPITSRIIENYLVAETTADKFSIRIGDSYVCISRKK
ncbi:type IV secretion system protein VirB9 [Helicobacter didelphidarum]|uniref:Type IV secretion system protein VirB9 n=1 Tax=Helicobacter didelphidarum TaxID=2040648 RepID=A0A3D8IL70_9HELI|nr:TrbG/VirB9 family P-type conjugative transfer protein [Helicobacter didelphidarum]RDU65770.1 type IV secretion system protein VirB9 [Helicobacter didelphidarum]